MRLNEAIEQLKYYQSKPYVPTVKKVCNIALDTIEAQQQENEKLQIQAAAMRDILQDMFDVAHACGSAYLYRHDVDRVMKAMEGDIDYHNPADTEAFGWVKEFIERVYNGLYESCPTGELSQEQYKYVESVQEWQSLLDAALKEIDKALGGKKNGI